jgi:hypothetical protein
LLRILGAKGTYVFPEAFSPTMFGQELVVRQGAAEDRY